MTKQQEKNLLAILDEASAKEIAEASSNSVVETPNKKLGFEETEITVEQNYVLQVLSNNEELELSIKKEKRKYERLKNSRFKDESEHWKTIYDLRKDYIPRLFYMVLCWLITAAGFVFLTAFAAPHFNTPNCPEYCFGFNLSDNVLIAFITSTTATVIGIFIIVAKWLFPANNKKEQKKKED